MKVDWIRSMFDLSKAMYANLGGGVGYKTNLGPISYGVILQEENSLFGYL